MLVIGLLSCCLSSIGYGFSRSFGAAVAWQVFGGAMNNVVAIVRCVVAELNPEKRYVVPSKMHRATFAMCDSARMIEGRNYPD